MRKSRIIQNGATYHVVAKANRGEFILDSKEVKILFLHTLKRARCKFHFKIKHYCIMSSHIHLLIEPSTGTSLSRIMQWILSVFARQYNKIIGQSGHVWYDRFKSNIIKSYQQYIRTFQYISNNPVKAGLCNIAKNYLYGGLYEFNNNRFELIDPQDKWMKFVLS